jgi:hypothetical protein
MAMAEEGKNKKKTSRIFKECTISFPVYCSCQAAELFPRLAFNCHHMLQKLSSHKKNRKPMRETVKTVHFLEEFPTAAMLG